MVGKAKSRCHLGLRKISKWRHSYLNVMKLESYDTLGEWLKKYSLNLTKEVFFVFFTRNFKLKKLQKWQTHSWNSHYKSRLNTTYYDNLCRWINKLTNFSCAWKQLQVCFPSAVWHSLLLKITVMSGWPKVWAPKMKETESFGLMFHNLAAKNNPLRVIRGHVP